MVPSESRSPFYRVHTLLCSFCRNKYMILHENYHNQFWVSAQFFCQTELHHMSALSYRHHCLQKQAIAYTAFITRSLYQQAERHMFKTDLGNYIHSDLNIVLLCFLELREASSIPLRTDRQTHISSQHPYRQEKEKKTTITSVLLPDETGSMLVSHH